VAAALEVARGPAAALCSQREVIAELVAGLTAALGALVPETTVGEPAKAGLLVLHVTGDDPVPALVAAESLPPPA
jgi:hypothetical protein